MTLCVRLQRARNSGSCVVSQRDPVRAECDLTAQLEATMSKSLDPLRSPSSLEPSPQGRSVAATHHAKRGIPSSPAKASVARLSPMHASFSSIQPHVGPFSEGALGSTPTQALVDAAAEEARRVFLHPGVDAAKSPPRRKKIPIPSLL